MSALPLWQKTLAGVDYLQDKAYNNHYYPNKAIILGWHTEKAELQWLRVSNNPALQPDHPSLLAASGILLRHTWKICQQAAFIETPRGPKADSSSVWWALKEAADPIVFLWRRCCFNFQSETVEILWTVK